MKCGILTTSCWYRTPERKTIQYYCSACYSHARKIRLGIFQNLRKKLNQRLCSNCGNKTLTTVTKNGYPNQKWYNDKKGGWWCNSCYHKITDDPELIRQRNQTRIIFKDKILHLGYNPRKGICEWCHKKIGDSYINCFGKIATIKKTHMHHIRYHDDNPLKDLVELCISCHRKETIRLRKVA